MLLEGADGEGVGAQGADAEDGRAGGVHRGSHVDTAEDRLGAHGVLVLSGEHAGVKVTKLGKISEGARPNALDLLKNGQLQMIVNTAAGMLPRKDENAMRAEAVLRGVYMASTMNAARAAILGIRSLREHPLTVCSLQEHAKVLPPKA